MIDKPMLLNFRKDFAEAVKTLEAKYGIVIELGNIKFGYDHFEGKITAKEGNDKEDINQKDFNQYCRLYGLEPEDFDRRVTLTDSHGTHDYIITGINPKNRRYPICLKRADNNSSWKWTAEAVRKACSR